jgi:outer membrane protein W
MQTEIASRWLIYRASKSVCVTARTLAGQYYDFRQKNGERFYMGYGMASLIFCQHSSANDNRPG